MSPSSSISIEIGAPIASISFLVARPVHGRIEQVTVYAWLGLSTLAYLFITDTWHSVLAGTSMALAIITLLGLFLAQEWSVAARSALGFLPAVGGGGSPVSATHVYVVPIKGDAKIVPLATAAVTTVSSALVGTNINSASWAAGGLLSGKAKNMLVTAPYHFTFCAALYEVGGDSSSSSSGAAGACWKVSALPVPDGETLGAYGAWKGWPSTNAARTVLARYGPNRVEVPVPAFLELAREHAVAPFFVFQLGCVALWCLDEYVWYSLFTLFMLTVMEAVLVGQRIMTARMLRGMRPALSPVFCYRGGEWAVVRGEDLVPLDIVSITRDAPSGVGISSSSQIVGGSVAPSSSAATAAANHAAVAAPADILLLRGTVVVNEAMLTGESTPQLKEALTSDTGPQETLNAFTKEGDHSHGRSVIYAGTLVMAADAGGETLSASPSSSSSMPVPISSSSPASSPATPRNVPSPPDGGCVGIVVRTGPATSQGELLRSIIGASSGRAAVDNDAFVFLGVMLIFALGASSYVLYHGLADPSRDRWKLVLHCIMIVTTVIPPELPVQLSLCTNASMAALAKRGIFCTEPSRIARAGTVDCVAFDKTGTLTADEFTVTAVAYPGPKGWTLAPRAAPASARLVMSGCHALAAVAVPVPPPPAPRPIPGAPPIPTPPIVYRIELAGDPLEKAALRSIGWTVDEHGVASPSTSTLAPLPTTGGIVSATTTTTTTTTTPTENVTVLRRWPFSSALRRMTTVVAVGVTSSSTSPLLGSLSAPDAPPSGSPGADAAATAAAALPISAGATFIVCKGAPEALEPLLSVIPDGYAAAHAALAAGGMRVLALAAKPLPRTPGKSTSSVTASLERTDAESGLIFCGFLVAASPLKTDSERAVKELRAAEVRVLMITGDAPLTAAAVARQLGLAGGLGAVYVLDVDEEAGGLVGGTGEALACRLVLAAGTGVATPTPGAPAIFSGLAVDVAPRIGEALAALSGQGGVGDEPLVCVTGRALSAVERAGGPGALSAVCGIALVFARVSPAQKAQVIAVLEGEGVIEADAFVTSGSGGSGGGAKKPLKKSKVWITAMVGDGSNDTGALKRATVGLAVISNPELERRYDAARLTARSRAAEKRASDFKLLETKLGPAWAVRQAQALALKGEDAIEDDEEFAALLKPERDKVAAIGALSGQEGPGEDAGIMGGFLKQVEAAAAAKASASAASANGNPPASSAATAQVAELQARIRELEAEASGEGGLGGVPVAALGDASMAAPLTSKIPTPLSIVEVLRSGRSTLVTSHTMFTILAVNSLTASYTLSVLYLNDVKTGDAQATFAGVLGSALFFAISFAKPRRRLSVEKPAARVLNWRLILTVAVQTLAHVIALMLVARLAGGYEPDTPAERLAAAAVEAAEKAAAALLASTSSASASTLSLASGGGGGGSSDFSFTEENPIINELVSDLIINASPSPGPGVGGTGGGATFKPNKVNTAVWLLTTASQAATFMTSYAGTPFMAPLNEMPTLQYGTVIVYAVTVLGALAWSTELNTAFQLVPMATQELRLSLAAVIIGDFVVCFGVDRLLRATLKA